MLQPEVQIVVRTHNVDRPLRRAVDSVLAYQNAGVVVVAHGVEPALLALPGDPRVKVVHLESGVGYPGAASNAGIAACTAPFVGLLDSDDWFEPGALEQLHKRIVADGAHGVLAPLRLAGQPPMILPLTSRTKNLQAARDKLFYRTAPLGLFRREVLQNPKFSFSEDFRTGEDMATSARLYTAGLKISYYASDPAYVVTDDADSRVSTARRPLVEQLEAIAALVAAPWVQSLPACDQQALVTKILRIHVLNLIIDHFQAGTWEEETSQQTERQLMADLLARLHRMSPDAFAQFVATEADVFFAVMNQDLERVKSAVAAIGGSSSLRRRVFPRRISDAFMPDTNVRRMLTAKRILLTNKSLAPVRRTADFASWR